MALAVLFVAQSTLAQPTPDEPQEDVDDPAPDVGDTPPPPPAPSEPDATPAPADAPATAATPEATPPQDAEAIVIRGQRLDTRARSSYPLSGISRDEFEEQPKSTRLADIVDRMPGVFGQGDLGANTDTGLRGLNHHWTRYEFDGVMLPGMDIGRDFRINRMSPIGVQEVLSLRNPPPEFESDGIGGHIFVLRRPIPRELELEGIVGGGMLVGDDIGTGAVGDVSVGVGGPLGSRWGYSVFASYDRFPLFKHRTVHITNLEDGAVLEDQVQRSEPIVETFGVFADVAYRYSGGEFHLKPMYSSYRQLSDSTTNRVEPERIRRVESEGTNPQTMPGVTLSNVHRLWATGALETDLSYFRSMQDSESTARTFEGPTEDRPLAGTVRTNRNIVHQFPQVRVQLVESAQLFGRPSVFKTGIMTRWRSYHTDDHSRSFDADGELTATTTPEGDFTVWENYYAFWAQDEIDVTDHFTILGGARIEYSDNSVEVFEDNPLNPLRGVTKDSDTFDINPSLSLAYRVGEAATFRGTVSRTINRAGFREQSTLELARDPIERGNPDLVATRSWNFDLGVDFRPRPEVFLAVTAYRKEMSDVVELVDTGETRLVDEDEIPIYQYDNIGDGIAQGIELEQRLGLGVFTPALAGLTLWANETVLETEVTLADGTQEPFNAHANFLANFGLDWAIRQTGTHLSFNLKYQGEYKNYRTSEDIETTDPTWYMNASIGQEIIDGLRITLEGQNLLGEKQVNVRRTTSRTEAAVNEYGRFFRLSVRGEI